MTVHSYGVPDGTPSDSGTNHMSNTLTSEIAETWFVIFDAGGHNSQKTALLAHKHDQNEFYGVCMSDLGFVDHILDHFNHSYGSSTHHVLSSL
jgi:hypothetical protein